MFYEQLDKICKEQQTSVTSVLNAIGASKGNIRNWKNGSVPKYELRLKISNYLGISIDKLLTDEEKAEREKQEIPASEQIKDIRFAAYNALEDESEEFAQDILNYINYKKSQKKKED